jgi:uncharacterized iron-regulated membrane protein
MVMKKLKRFLYLFHRWLGVALCLWFALLFASGIIMMYVEYPELTEDERLWQMEALDAAAVHLTPSEAAQKAGADTAFSDIRLSTILGRPAYQFTDAAGHSDFIFADDGSKLGELTDQQALLAAQHSTFAAQGGVPRYTGLIGIDQWTVSSELNASRPLYRVALDDKAGTVLYISSHTGQIVRDTNAAERFWNWLGSTVHWIYPWQFRQHAGLWAWVLTYLSLAGVLSVVSGAVIGWWRLRVKRPYHGERMTPYHGWQKWHHVLGLSFLVFITTWIFSGLTSMSPFGWFDNATSADEQTARYYGGDLDDLAAFPALTTSALNGDEPVKEVEWRRIGDTHYLVLSHSATDKSLVLPDNATTLKRVMEHAMLRLQPDATIQEQRLISTYDSWYYTHHNRYRPLPVLEVRFDDPEHSWYYLDLNTGAVVQRLTTTDRWARWLYNGLHSLDFAPLFSHRPLWDIVVIVLCLAGLGFSVTSVVVGWRRLKAKV